MKKMASSNVLVVGMKGLGVEIGELTTHAIGLADHAAKNVALAGVKSVTVYDPAPVEVADLGTQVGSSRHILCPRELTPSSFCARKTSASREPR